MIITVKIPPSGWKWESLSIPPPKTLTCPNWQQSEECMQDSKGTNSADWGALVCSHINVPEQGPKSCSKMSLALPYYSNTQVLAHGGTIKKHLSNINMHQFNLNWLHRFSMIKFPFKKTIHLLTKFEYSLLDASSPVPLDNQNMTSKIIQPLWKWLCRPSREDGWVIKQNTAAKESRLIYWTILWSRIALHCFAYLNLISARDKFWIKPVCDDSKGVGGGGGALDWMHYVTAGIKLHVTLVKCQEGPLPLSLGRVFMYMAGVAGSWS